MIEFTLSFLVWALCGVLAYGLTFAYFQRRFNLAACENYYADLIHALFVAVLGPGGLLAALVFTRCRHGVKFR